MSTGNSSTVQEFSAEVNTYNNKVVQYRNEYLNTGIQALMSKVIQYSIDYRNKVEQYSSEYRKTVENYCNDYRNTVKH